MNVHVARLSAAIAVTSVNEVIADLGNGYPLSSLTVAQDPKLEGAALEEWQGQRMVEYLKGMEKHLTDISGHVLLKELVLGEELTGQVLSDEGRSGDVQMAEKDEEILEEADEDHVADPINTLLSNVQLRADDDAWADLDESTRVLAKYLPSPPPAPLPLPALLSHIAKSLAKGSEFKPLVPEQGRRADLEAMIADLKAEYEARKRVLIHQLHISLSFLLPDKPDIKLLLPHLPFMAPQAHVTLYHLFTTQADTLAAMLQRVNSEKPPVRSLVKTVVIGNVPDRGGRPNEGKMAAFRPRAAAGVPAAAAGGGGGRGGGGGYGGRGGGRGGRGGGRGGGKRNLKESGGEKEGGKRTRGASKDGK